MNKYNNISKYVNIIQRNKKLGREIMYRGHETSGTCGTCENCNGTGFFQYNTSEDPMVCPCCGGSSGITNSSFVSSAEFERMSDFSEIIDTLDREYTNDFITKQKGFRKNS